MFVLHPTPKVHSHHRPSLFPMQPSPSPILCSSSLNRNHLAAKRRRGLSLSEQPLHERRHGRPEEEVAQGGAVPCAARREPHQRRDLCRGAGAHVEMVGWTSVGWVIG